MRIKEHLLRNTILRSYRVLDPSERKKIALVAVAQTTLGFLDLLGVAIIGLIGSLAVTGIQSKSPNEKIANLLNHVALSNLTLQKQVAILGLIAAVILVGRSLLTMFISRKILMFLSFKSAYISSKLIGELLSRNITQVNRKSSQETLYAVTTGVEALMLNVTGTAISVFSDTFLLSVLSIGLFIFDPFMAFSTFFLFSFVSLVLYFLTQRRVAKMGEFISMTSVASNIKILEVVNAFREIFVHDRQGFYSNEISNTRNKLAKTNAELSFIPNISKYVLEITMVLGGMLFSAIEFILHDSDKAISTLAIFIASASRIAPAILRLQSGVIAIKSNLGVANLTLEMIDYLSPIRTLNVTSEITRFSYDGFNPNISISDANFTYPGNSRPTIRKLDLEISAGEIVAFVGSSGAGKSTIIDLILGLRNLESGVIRIAGLDPTEAIKKWPGAISYVPQTVHISDASILENVAFGYSEPNIELAWEALEAAQLSQKVKGLSEGINTRVGENGNLLSGGERQRLGIARALYTKPKLLVLDEATSSLDANTEVEISNSIKNLRGKTTILLVAHRLSSVTSADQVVYMKFGEIVAKGKFAEVKELVPDFESQARLMGL